MATTQKIEEFILVTPVINEMMINASTNGWRFINIGNYDAFLPPPEHESMKNNHCLSFTGMLQWSGRKFFLPLTLLKREYVVK